MFYFRREPISSSPVLDVSRYLYSQGERLATLRAMDGLFTLSMLGASRLHSFLQPPRLRVVVSGDAVPFVAKGGNAFAKHVLSVDPEIRAGEEVLVTDSQEGSWLQAR